MISIAVLGAGINGLACAVKLKEKYPRYDVAIISDDFTPNTTGDGSGGLWYPYLCGNTSQQKLNKWGGETYKLLFKLWREGGHDISLMPMYELHRTVRDAQKPEWADLVLGYNIIDRKQLDYIKELHSIPYVYGQTFNTFVMYSPSILAYLSKRFKEARGRVVRAKVTSLRDPRLKEYDVVVNCLGLGARDVVPDPKVFPIRGQITKVTTTWINETFIDEDTGHYIIPNAKVCVMGGTHQDHNFSRHVDEADKDFILTGCQQLIPSLKHAELLEHWVGLRPGRENIRLEPETIDGKLFIHNYGHGGSGMTLFWGCSSEVMELLDKHVEITEKHNEKSKL